MKLGTAQIPSNSDDVTITDIGFEPKVFSAWCQNGTRFEVTYDDFTNNIHTYGINTGSAEYCRIQSQIQSKSTTSLVWRNPIGALRGQTMYYSAIG